jgi:hypothetical protein
MVAYLMKTATVKMAAVKAPSLLPRREPDLRSIMTLRASS